MATTDKVKSWTFDIAYRGSSLTVSSLNKKNVLTIELSRVFNDDLSEDEITLLDKLDEQRKEVGDSYQYALSKPECEALVSIRAKMTPSKDGPITTGMVNKENGEVRAHIESASQKMIAATPTVQPAGVTETHDAQIIALRGKKPECDLEAKVASLQAIEKVSELWCVNYDIPCVVDQTTGKRLSKGVVENPSREWWHYGARLTLSQWLFTKEGLDSERVQARINDWLSKPELGIKVRVIKQCPSQTEVLKGWAREKLREMVSQAHTALIDRLASADQRLEDVLKELESWEANGAHSKDETQLAQRRASMKWANEIRLVLRDAGDDLNAAISCATLFDETENVRDLLDGLRMAVRSQEKTFNAVARVQQIKAVRIELLEV